MYTVLPKESVDSSSTSYQVQPGYKPMQFGLEKAAECVRRYFDYHPQQILLLSCSAVVVGWSLLRSSTFRSLSHFIPNYFLFSITAIGMLTLLGLTYQWKHVPANLVGVPLLSSFGIQWRHGMEEKKFEERKCFKAKDLLGQVFFEKQKDGHSLPVLELYSQDPYEHGLAQGYLLGKQIDDIFHRVLKPMLLLAQVATGDFLGSHFQRQVKKIAVPKEYVEEVRGLVAGVQAYAKETGYQTDLTEETILNAHKITDIYKAILVQKILGFSCLHSMGCSTAVIKKEQKMGACHTLDWPSLGRMGEFVILRRHQVGSIKVEMQTFPGIIGALVGHNDQGLIAIINECGTISTEGIPYSLLTRQILDQAGSVKEAKDMIDRASYQPASSHHLMLADSQEAIHFQMLATPDKKYLARSLSYKDKNEYLIVTNHAIDEDNRVMEHTIADSTSKQRYQAMESSIKENIEKDLPLEQTMRHALLAVNTVDTVACAIFMIQNSGKVTPEQYVHDNNFAALHLNVS